ncbi:hypothetical protein, partial [Streptomyces roseolilacinus]|uniref:hypothetical protein n=1 Tax=Streptomyces roseolilacinus TaxID=66904 RepID=UPI003812E097
HVIDNLVCKQKGMTVTKGENREWTFTPPVLPSGIIPARSDGETRNAALFDLRLCASLLIVVLVLVVRVRPAAAMDTSGLWLLAGCVVVGVMGWSRRSHLRVVRLRQS